LCFIFHVSVIFSIFALKINEKMKSEKMKINY